MGAGILSGLRIVEISAFVAAPLGGATLAAMGADVIRVAEVEHSLEDVYLELVESPAS